jgi:hypothetical protein
MFEFFRFVQFLAYVAIIVFGIVWIRSLRLKTAPKRAHQARKSALSAAGTITDAELTSVREAQQYNLASTGVPSVQAGGFVHNVPTFDPRQEGSWDANREVLTTARVIGYTEAGANPMDLIELSGGYLLAVANGASFLFQKLDLTDPEADYLQEERDRACRTADHVIENFQGHSWLIKGAYGDNQAAWRRSGDRSVSYIQVLSVHPNLGETGRRSTLPPVLLDGAVHDYFDLRAYNQEEPSQRLFFFYSGQKWSCYVGHQLSKAEADRIAGI